MLREVKAPADPDSSRGSVAEAFRGGHRGVGGRGEFVRQPDKKAANWSYNRPGRKVGYVRPMLRGPGGVARDSPRALLFYRAPCELSRKTTGSDGFFVLRQPRTPLATHIHEPRDGR